PVRAGGAQRRHRLPAHRLDGAAASSEDPGREARRRARSLQDRRVRRATLVFVLRAALPAGALALALRGVAWPAVTETLRGATVVPLLALVAVNGLLMTVKGARLRWLLGRAASLRCCLLAKLTASAMNSVVPFRGGDLARLWMLERHARISKTVAAAVAVVESLFELAALASVALVGALLSHQRWAALASAVLASLAAVLIAVARGLARRPTPAPGGAAVDRS